MSDPPPAPPAVLHPPQSPLICCPGGCASAGRWPESAAPGPSATGPSGAGSKRDASLRHHTAVATDRELYGIEVDTATRRAIIVGNYGDFIVVDIDKLPPTTTTFPTF